jgi:hypothetical protein
MQFVLVNHRSPRGSSGCAACSQSFQQSYLRDLSTQSWYCSVDCYAGRAASMAGALAKADPFALVPLFMVLPKVTIDVASAIADSASRD